MRPIIWILLAAPPCLAALTWLMTRGWTWIVMRGRPTRRIAIWQKYDFWIILGNSVSRHVHGRLDRAQALENTWRRAAPRLAISAVSYGLGLLGCKVGVIQ